MSKHEVNEKKDMQVNELDVDAALATLPEEAGDFDQKDQIVPRFKIIQALSGEVQRDKPQYVDGAKVGDFCLTSTREVFDGRKGVTFVPSAYRREYPVFIPQTKGGGFIRLGSEAEFNALEANDKGQRLTAEGHEVVETGTYYGFLVKADGESCPVVISMAKSAFKSAKQLGTYLTTYREQTKQGKRPVPPYWRAFELSTISAQNKAGQTYETWQIRPLMRTLELPNGAALMEAAKEFREFALKGSVKADHGVDE